MATALQARLYFVVHGIVQGVGYRAFVKRVALANDIKGIARNSPNGTVEILAQGSVERLKRFESQIDIDIKNGPSVMQIERYAEHEEGFPKDPKVYDRFVIEEEK